MLLLQKRMVSSCFEFRCPKMLGIFFRGKAPEDRGLCRNRACNAEGLLIVEDREQSFGSGAGMLGLEAGFERHPS